MIQFTCGGYDMCGQIRMCWPAQALQSEGDTEVMCSRKSFIGLPTTHFYIQRCLQQPIYDGLRKIDSKLYVDFDDMLFKLYGEELPKYNFCKSKFDINETTRVLKDNLDRIDKIVVSTEFLKRAIVDNFNYDRVEVIENMLPRWLYHFDRRSSARYDKPRVLYAGGMTHYGLDGKDTGDFSKPLIEFLRKNIDKIELIFVGPVPWFLSDLSDKIISIPFVNVLQLPRVLHDIRPDFYLAPLRECVFNKCKSDLKYLEACTIGAVCIASDFDDSPYAKVHEAAKITNTMTAKNIENNFWRLCDPELFIEVQNRQYEFMNSRWLENNTERYKQLFKTEQVRI